jgi:hypothetical protein
MRSRRLTVLTPRAGSSRRAALSWLLAGAFALAALAAAVLPGPARAQGFNWKRYAGTEIRVFGPIIPQLDRIKASLPQFEQLTGIKVTLETFPDAQLRQKTLIEATADRRTYEQMVLDPDEMMALVSVRNLQRHLACGVTTLRDNGGRNRVTFLVREAINRGYFVGPRLLLAAP